MTNRQMDIAAIAVFGAISAVGWWLWSIPGASLWLNSFMVLCGIG